MPDSVAISGLTELTVGNLASGDLLVVVDVSDTTQAPTGTTKKMNIATGFTSPVVFKAPDGAVGTPAFTFTNDPDSGLYRIGANNIGLALNGTKVVDFATTGIAITGTVSSSSNATIGGTLGVMGVTTANGIVNGAGSAYTWSGRSQMLSTADGVVLFWDNANTSFNRFQMGGTDTNYPALARNGAGLRAVLADGSLDTTFQASTITASVGFSGSLTGNASTATALQTARTINGVSFDGTANIVVTAAAGTLTGTTLNATVVTSSLTTVGTIGAGVWQGTSIATTFTDAKIKTVTGTSNRLTIGGTATDPTFDISTAYVGQATITTLGTIATGTWQGTAIVDTYLATIATAGKVSNSATTAASANTASAIVARDGSGNFSAGTITAALTGNASTATALATSRTIWGQSFDGSANVSGALTGVTTITTSGAINGQTISSSANFTGSATIASGFTVSAGVSSVRQLLASRANVPGGTANSIYDDGVFGSPASSNTGITIFAAGQVGIAFGDGDSATIGQLRYQHSTDAMEFITNGSTALTISSAQLATFTGRIITDNTTDATNTTNGSLQTDGGLSVAKKGYFGETVTTTGIVAGSGDIAGTIKPYSDATVSGMFVPVYAINPTSPVNNTMWYNSATNTLNVRVGGATKTVALT